ncbi:MAG: hypothetical protein V1720_07600 [bacterium]
MKNIFYSFSAAILLILFTISPGCKDNPSEPAPPDTVTARKPNIYLYPEKNCSLHIQLEFPEGGLITQSIPEYGRGWNVDIDSAGKINGVYDFLFYESKTPNLFQYTSGWIVERDSLEIFFRSNLSEAGFIKHEINDFIEYWIPRLTDSPYYIIYPQFIGEIEKMIQLKFSIQPDNILRLFYVVKTTNSLEVKLNTPRIPYFNRKGFVVAEWGVVI